MLLWRSRAPRRRAVVLRTEPQASPPSRLPSLPHGTHAETLCRDVSIRRDLPIAECETMRGFSFEITSHHHGRGFCRPHPFPSLRQSHPSQRSSNRCRARSFHPALRRQPTETRSTTHRPSGPQSSSNLPRFSPRRGNFRRFRLGLCLPARDRQQHFPLPLDLSLRLLRP